MREERVYTPARFLVLLNDYFWRLAQFYSSEHLENVKLPKVLGIQEKILRITGFAYGLISIGAYQRAYLSELNLMIIAFVREYEEVLDLNCSDEDKMDKLDSVVFNFDMRLASLEWEIKREYILKVIENCLEAHRSVLGKDFGLKDLLVFLKSVVDLDEDEEKPLT